MQGEIRVSEHRLDEPRVKRPFLPRMVRRFAIPLIFFWGFSAVTMTSSSTAAWLEVCSSAAWQKLPLTEPDNTSAQATVCRRRSRGLLIRRPL